MKENKTAVPRLAAKIFQHLVPPQELIYMNDYFEDIYESLYKSRGRHSARFFFWGEILKSLPGFVWNTLYWRVSMFKNYITIALRNIRKHKVYSAINIVGLSLGLAVCLLIFLWVQDELGYDRFHSKKDRIVQVYSQIHLSNDQSQIWMGSYYPLARVLKEEIPEVASASRYEEAQNLLIKYGDKRFTNDTIGLADSSFFDIFSFPFLSGKAETALADKFSAVVTETMARKYFGNDNPMGKTLTINGELDMQVTGVIADVPSQSSLQFDCIVPFVLSFGPSYSEPEHWGGNPLQTYALLTENPDLASISQKITAVVQSHKPRETSEETFHLHPLKRMHLLSPEGGGLIGGIVTFSIIALFVLVIACINFMNLSTAQASTRTREVGLRKVVGARKSDLVRQFIGESFTITLITLVFAVLLLRLFLPAFNQLLGKQLSLALLLKPAVLAGFLAITLFTGFFSGSYPAFFLSAFPPVSILRKLPPTGFKSLTFRKILVVVQFSLSIFLIITMAMTFKQLRFLLHNDLGFDRENLIAIRTTASLKNQFDSFKGELLSHPGIFSVTKSLQGPWNIGSTVGALAWDGKPTEESVSMNWDRVDFDYFETLGLSVIEGRSFSKDFPSDLNHAYIVNEEAVKLMGMENPVGKRLSVFRNEGTIIGVVKNFHFQPMYQEIKPFVFILNPDSSSYALIRIAPGNPTAGLAHIQSVYEQFEKNMPFAPLFFNKILVDHIYTSELQMIKISGFFTILAIFISCLGLFGLAAFLAERRTKEIGVRKVLGASETGLVFMLSREFTKWVIVANVFSWPAAYLVIRKLHESYAYKVAIGLDVFIFSGLAALFIALAAVSFHTVHAARKNPVHSLRYE
jgi:putative ABC transport system permease protein